MPERKKVKVINIKKKDIYEGMTKIEITAIENVKNRKKDNEILREALKLTIANNRDFLTLLENPKGRHWSRNVQEYEGLDQNQKCDSRPYYSQTRKS